MNLVELDRALRQLRLGGMAAVLEGRLLQAQTEHMAPIDLMSSSSPTSSVVERTACSNAEPSTPASASRTAHSTTSTSISTRR